MVDYDYNTLPAVLLMLLLLRTASLAKIVAALFA
jgi:hypothetical protein